MVDSVSESESFNRDFGEIPGSLSSTNNHVQSHLNPLSSTSDSRGEHLYLVFPFALWLAD